VWGLTLSADARSPKISRIPGLFLAPRVVALSFTQTHFEPKPCLPLPPCLGRLPLNPDLSIYTYTSLHIQTPTSSPNRGCRFSARPPTRAWEVARTVAASPSSVVKCLWGVFVWGLGCCSCRVCVCRGCCSLSVCVCVCDLLLFLHTHFDSKPCLPYPPCLCWHLDRQPDGSGQAKRRGDLYLYPSLHMHIHLSLYTHPLRTQPVSAFHTHPLRTRTVSAFLSHLPTSNPNCFCRSLLV